MRSKLSGLKRSLSGKILSETSSTSLDAESSSFGDLSDEYNSDKNAANSSESKKKRPRFWTKDEDEFLKRAVERHGTKLMRKAAKLVPNRTYKECVQRWTKVLAPGLKKGKWCSSEDERLRELVNAQLISCSNKERDIMWGEVSRGMGSRSSKQCRERWLNHLDPTVNKCEWTEEEDELLCSLAEKFPGRWAQIARKMPGRTENMVKVHWKSLKRKQRTSEQNKEKVDSKNEMVTTNPGTGTLDSHESGPNLARSQTQAFPALNAFTLPDNINQYLILQGGQGLQQAAPGTLYDMFSLAQPLIPKAASTEFQNLPAMNFHTNGLSNTLLFTPNLRLDLTTNASGNEFVDMKNYYVTMLRKIIGTAS